MNVWLGLWGLGLLLYRLGPRQQAEHRLYGDLPPIKIVVPVHNEASQLGHLLASLPPQLAVRVVEASSEDGTEHPVLAAEAEVITPPPLPPGWSGKNWASYCGAQDLDCDWLLFLDANTELQPEYLGRWIATAQAEQWDMSCALPWHRCETLWEKASGALHLFYLLATAVQAQPHPQRLYANGQCVLIRRSAYAHIGHGQVRGELAEDVAMARRCLEQGFRYGVYHQPVYQIRRYATWQTFLEGWTQSLRQGMGANPAGPLLESTLVMLLLLGLGGWGLWGLGILLVLSYQRRVGGFAPWGALFSPLAALIFMGLALTAQGERILKRPIHRKSRTYSS